MSTPILIEPGTRFTCDPCGFCCGFWDIHVDRQRREMLGQKDWVNKRAQELRESPGKDLFKIVDQSGLSIIQRANGACSFLNEQLLCSIHSIDGFDAKPLVCQQFPNIYYRTPRGIEVYLDYSCPEVIKNNGALITAEAVSQTLSREFVQEIGSTFSLDASTRLDWEGYTELERTFLEILQKLAPWEEQLLLLDEILKALRRNLGRTTGTCDATEVRRALDSINRAELDSLVAKARSSTGSISKRDLYVAILVQWVESTFSGEVGPRPLGAGKVITNVLKQWKGIGNNEFKVFGFRLDYSQVSAVGFDPKIGALRDPVDRYLRYLIKSLVATQAMTLQKRMAIIATNFALVKWLSRAHASSSSRRHVTLDDVVFAIKMVEKFLSYRLFNRLESKKNFLSNFVGLLFDNPALPATMLA
jgi:Fe-S-cluster containining protein